MCSIQYRKLLLCKGKKRVVLTLPHRISNPKSLISLQPTKAFMRLSWCVSGIWGWEVFTTAHKVILAATSPSQMGNIAFILRGAAPQIWISQKWCVTHLGAKNPRLGWDIRRRVLDVPLDHHTKPDYQETSWSLILLHAFPLILFEGYLTDRCRLIWSCLSHTLMVQVSDEFLQHPRTNICGWKLAETWRLRLRNGWVSQFKTCTHNSLSLPSNIQFEDVFKTQGGGWPVRHTAKVSRAKPPVFHWDWLHPVPSWQGLHRLHPYGELFWRLHHAGRRSLSNTDL